MWVKAKIKDDWHEAGRIFFIIGKSVRVNVQNWTPIVYDGEEDPDFIKSAAVEIIQKKAKEKKHKHNWFYSPATFSKYCVGCHKLQGYNPPKTNNKQ